MPSFNAAPLQMLANSGQMALPPNLGAGTGYVASAVDAAAGAAATDAAQQRLRQRRRVPLPREAVAELRALLKRDRYPQPETREELARRHGLERRRVDRWLENARAREASRSNAMLKAEPS